MAEPIVVSILILHKKGFVIFRFLEFSEQPPNIDAETLRMIFCKIDDYTTRFQMLEAQTEVPHLIPSTIVNISMQSSRVEGNMFGVFDPRVIEMWSEIEGDLGLLTMDDVYAKFISRMNPTRVVIDNESCEHATIIEVVSANRHGLLLEVVQVLTDLNLIITKAYISSDGGWFMDVFNVTDCDGNKIRDEGFLNYIQKTLETDTLRGLNGVMPCKEHTSIELTSTDRPGLLSEVFAVLTNLRCNVVNSEIWTHNSRAAAVIYVTDQETGGAIENPKQLSMMNELLCNVLKVNSNFKTPRLTISSSGIMHTQRRLHQMMFADRDFERLEGVKHSSRNHVCVLDCNDRDYTVVTVRSKDRPKLLFDTLCSLADMQYVVFHGTVITERMEAYQTFVIIVVSLQEYYIRHMDGLPELELELCTDDRLGLLSDITRIFRENGLCIKQAEISTRGGKAKDTFFVTDVYGKHVDPKIIGLIKQQIGQNILQVKGNLNTSPKLPQETARSFLFTNLFRSLSSQNFGLIRSYP
ncbi:act domain-containing protein acr4 [Quercus suber]|uniref:ACT domain-containing protein ACR n=1 Tax=Quercus suber TaxID=58331 RepID=A0AAW0LQ27_QUESU